MASRLLQDSVDWSSSLFWNYVQSMTSLRNEHVVFFSVPETWGSTKSRICSSVPSDNWRTSTLCKCLMLASTHTHTGLDTHWPPHTLNHSRKKQSGLRCKNVESTPARFQISTSHWSLMKSFPSSHTLGLIFTPPKFSPSLPNTRRERETEKEEERQRQANIPPVFYCFHLCRSACNLIHPLCCAI